MEGRAGTGTSSQGEPAGTPGGVHTRTLLPVARSVGAARHWLAELPLGGVSLRNAQLVLSELVTNCVVHAGLDEERDRIGLTLRGTPAGVRIEVRDPGPGFDPAPVAAQRGSPLAGGHGLAIVDRLTDRWGVDRSQGTCVWFEMDHR